MIGDSQRQGISEVNGPFFILAVLKLHKNLTHVKYFVADQSTGILRHIEDQ